MNEMTNEDVPPALAESEPPKSKRKRRTKAEMLAMRSTIAGSVLPRDDAGQIVAIVDEHTVSALAPRRGFSVRPFFRWYDLWIGIYIDTAKRAVYICPLPMLGLKVTY